MFWNVHIDVIVWINVLVIAGFTSNLVHNILSSFFLVDHKVNLWYLDKGSTENQNLNKLNHIGFKNCSSNAIRQSNNSTAENILYIKNSFKKGKMYAILCILYVILKNKKYVWKHMSLGWPLVDVLIHVTFSEQVRLSLCLFGEMGD